MCVSTSTVNLALVIPLSRKSTLLLPRGGRVALIGCLILSVTGHARHSIPCCTENLFGTLCPFRLCELKVTDFILFSIEVLMLCVKPYQFFRFLKVNEVCEPLFFPLSHVFFVN